MLSENGSAHCELLKGPQWEHGRVGNVHGCRMHKLHVRSCIHYKAAKQLLADFSTSDSKVIVQVLGMHTYIQRKHLTPRDICLYLLARI